MKKKKKSELNKKGISGVIVTVLMIALVLAVVVIVWNVINNLVGEKLEEAESCFDIFGKVSLNSQYTCYDSTNDEVRFSVNVGDIALNKVIVSISAEGSTTSYELSSEDNSNLDSYPTSGQAVTIPGKNSGKTYTADYTSKPDKIQIIPVVGIQQCEVADSVADIEECID